MWIEYQSFWNSIVDVETLCLGDLRASPAVLVSDVTWRVVPICHRNAGLHRLRASTQRRNAACTCDGQVVTPNTCYAFDYV